jgi:hypothetical protein
MGGEVLTESTTYCKRMKRTPEKLETARQITPRGYYQYDNNYYNPASSKALELADKNK